MILAKIIRNKENNHISEFSLKGHADSAEYGKDIVCAAVSVLSISTVNGLQKYAHVNPKVNSDDANGGLLEVSIPDANNHDDQIAADAILSTFQNGMDDISHSYAKFVKLDITFD